VKWFKRNQGLGSSSLQVAARTFFVHISAVEKAGLSSLNEGQTVEYERLRLGKTPAENLKV